MARTGLFIFLLLAVATQAKNNCPDQFIQIGSFCYLFSNAEEDWAGAKGFCDALGMVHEETVVLAVLDYGLSIDDNQLLLTNITNRGGSYWLGGNLDQNSGIWKWIDQANREIDLHANYWFKNHPTSDGNCLRVTDDINLYDYSYRSYVGAADCAQSSKVICQVIPKEIGFRSIGIAQFYFSAENNVYPKSWYEAQQFCSSLEPPHRFNNVDLAVLGVNNEVDQELLEAIADIGTDTWLGGHNFVYGNGSMTWVDERDIEPNSYFLDEGYAVDYPAATYNGNYDWYTYANVTSTIGHARSALRICCPGCDFNVHDIYICGSSIYSFVCQAFKI